MHAQNFPDCLIKIVVAYPAGGLGCDPVKDLVPVAVLATNSNAIVVNPSLLHLWTAVIDAADMHLE